MSASIGFYIVKSWLRHMTLEMHSMCIRLRRFILHSEYGKMPAHNFLIGRNQPTVRPSEVKTPVTHCGVMVSGKCEWCHRSSPAFLSCLTVVFSADTESRSKKQRAAHKQKQKVNSLNHSRYIGQASLTYILTTCHPASLAEEVTWAPLPPAFWELYKRNKQN